MTRAEALAFFSMRPRSQVAILEQLTPAERDAAFMHLLQPFRYPEPDAAEATAKALAA